METAGLFNFERFQASIMPYTDMIYFDIKLIDPVAHRKYCGVSNKQILRNFIRLHELAKHASFTLLPRTPLIPGITDGVSEIEALAQFHREQHSHETHLLPGNPSWLQKLDRIGQQSTFSCIDPIHSFYDPDEENRIRAQFERHGIKVSIV